MADTEWEEEAEWEQDKVFLVGTIVPLSLLSDIGAVAVYYSHLDWQLSYAIWSMLGLKEWKGQLITQSIASYASRVDLFRSLAYQRYRNAETRVRITKIVESLRFAGDDRNRLMHDTMHSSSMSRERGKTALLTMRLNPVAKVLKEHKFDADTIRDLQDRLNGIRWILFDFTQKDRAWLSAPLPSLDKSPTLLLRREEEQKQRQGKRPRQPGSSRRKSRFRRA